LPVVVRWLASDASLNTLLEEVGKSAEAMSEIVKAVKTYSYLDQAPIQEVDVRESLENTLVLLRPKIKAGVSVTRDYSEDVPRIEAYGSELNQVWTNIIDNAIDAMQARGELALHTYTEDSDVVVEIVDNGPGIPSEIQRRIFEPFFTTKKIGEGTGLGLAVVKKIADEHAARVRIANVLATRTETPGAEPQAGGAQVSLSFSKLAPPGSATPPPPAASSSSPAEARAH
jgi:signal transduction histidine kinase